MSPMGDDDIKGRTKRELLEIARRKELPGRSRMAKQELIDAIQELDGEATRSDPARDAPPGIRLPGIDPDERREARAKREALYERIAGLVDQERRCPWRSVEGHPCGLPTVVGHDHCGLHGGGDIYDTAIPITGALGFPTWPTLWRHLQLATYDIDPIGLDPVVAEMAWHVLNGFYFDYFRVRVDGIENVPLDGAAMLVANHGGAALPYDAAMLALSVLNEAPLPRRVRIIGTEIFNMLPWISHMYRKAGAAYATRADARHLLDRGAILGVFPEGESGFMKPVWQAYQVQRFGRGGFVELAEETGTPIVPVAIVGSEEVHPAVGVSRRLARLVRFFFPQQRVEEIAVFLNPVPLPVRWHIRFLPQVEAENPGSAPEPLQMLERTEEIRRSVQVALDEMLAERRTAF